MSFASCITSLRPLNEPSKATASEGIISLLDLPSAIFSKASIERIASTWSVGLLSFMALKTNFIPSALADSTARMASASPSALRILDSFSPSAARTADSLSASAAKITAVLAPSASSTAAALEPSALRTDSRR